MKRLLVGGIRLMAMCQIADGATFLLVAGQYGISGETNPIIRFLWNLGPIGFVYVVVIKLVVIWWTLVMVRLTILRDNPKVALTLLLVAAMIGLVGAVSNVWSFLILSRGA